MLAYYIIVVYFTNMIYLDAFLAVIFDSMDPTRDANANPNPSLYCKSLGTRSARPLFWSVYVRGSASASSVVPV